MHTAAAMYLTEDGTFADSSRLQPRLKGRNRA
jgi:hypothetical protein